ncbi:MAG: MgtC/SapB family protein [Firmicutes bacterium]|nr:MgtC/SapB family protein [Bacillota bacterium]
MASGELVLRLFVSVLLGGLVGLERERHNRPAGLRTHILVCLGSALIMIVSFAGFSGAFGFSGDPARIAAQVVSGIGFLGAGTILRQGGFVRGLTTAASLWVVAAIGLSVGIGLYLPAVLTTVLILMCLWLLNKIDASGADHHRKRELWLRINKNTTGVVEQVGSILKSMNIALVSMHLAESCQEEKTEQESIELTMAVNIPAETEPTEFMTRIMQLPGLLEAGMERAKRQA